MSVSSSFARSCINVTTRPQLAGARKPRMDGAIYALCVERCESGRQIAQLPRPLRIRGSLWSYTHSKNRQTMLSGPTTQSRMMSRPAQPAYQCHVGSMCLRYRQLRSHTTSIGHRLHGIRAPASRVDLQRSTCATSHCGNVCLRNAIRIGQPSFFAPNRRKLPVFRP